MNNLQLFSFNENEVRIWTDENGDPWFVLIDICKTLELTSSTKVQNRLDPDGVNQIQVIDSMGRNQLTTIVNEPAMYEVIFRSDKPEAATFRRWVTKEVLPAIRKQGAYLTDKRVEEIISNPDTVILLANQVKAERIEKLKLKAQAESLIVQNGLQAKELEKSARKVQHYDEAMQSPDIFRTSILSTELGFKSANALHKNLKMKGVLKKVQGVWVLTSKYEGRGYTGPIKDTYRKSNNPPGLRCQQAGQFEDVNSLENSFD
jgi:anti-repressor protein